VSTYEPGDPTEIRSVNQLREYFEPASPVRGRMGIEWEQLPLDGQNRLVSFDGEGGVEGLLSSIASRNDPIMENGRITALRLRTGGMVALEPGAQVEIATPPLDQLDPLQRFLAGISRELDEIARRRGFRLAPWGMAPHDGEEDLSDVPKARYRLLKRHLKSAGPRGRKMMKLTASTQISIDYENEADMRRKVASALVFLPHLVAFTANSPVALGRRSRWLSQRPWIWRGTDAPRCGLPSFLFSEDLGYRQCAQYGLSRPLLMVVRDGQYVAGDGRTFREWWRKPGKWGPLTLEDWHMHWSTLFPEIRPRGYLEIRSVDSIPLPLVMASAALVKGLLAPAALSGDWVGSVPKVKAAAARGALLEAARLGPRWRPNAGPSPTELMPLLLSVAAQGLASVDESDAWLSPLRDLVERGACLADLWHRDDEGIWGGPEAPDLQF
jgi:glutamate--cysteine ligase